MSIVRGYSDDLPYNSSTLDNDLDESESQAIQRAFEQCEQNKPMYVVNAHSNSDLKTVTLASAKVYCFKK